jgi:hypothetical protein
MPAEPVRMIHTEGEEIRAQAIDDVVPCQYVSRNNYTAYLLKPVLFEIHFAVKIGNTPLNNGICHDDKARFFGVLKKWIAQQDSVGMDHYELHIRRIRRHAFHPGDCNSWVGTTQKVYTLHFPCYVIPTRLCFDDGSSVFVTQEV